MKTQSTKHLSLKTQEEALFVLGENDNNLKNIERRTGARLFYEQHSNGEFSIEIKGRQVEVNKAFKQLLELRTGFAGERKPRAQETPGKTAVSAAGNGNVIYTSYSGRKIAPLSPAQGDYIDAIRANDLVISIGPAGTGKTFLAVACALSMLDAGKVEKIVLTRPVVEAGEKLGFLPGDLYEKVSPYLKPLYDSFYYMLGAEKFRKYRDEEIIEIVPLAYMRGRTLEDAFIILDEAQNTLPEQMKMFLTRFGFNSQAVITGDVTQIDLERKTLSGLVLSEQILSGIEGISFIKFSERDVVRHHLVREIIKAYDRWEKRTK